MAMADSDTGSITWGATGKVGASFAGEVALRGISLRDKGKDILSGVTATFEAGKISCLLGPSGCGKTSLLRLIAGITIASEGMISIGGAEMAGQKQFVPPERRNVGFVFQDFALFPHMTAVENVAYGLYALSRSEALASARRGLERVGLLQMADRYPGSLSGGEQQRVALARAIVPRPQVILLDEPFSGLDQRMRDQVRAETIAIVRETGATAILVTHDPWEALDAADHIFLMRAGRIVQDGTPQEMYGRPFDMQAAQFFASHNVVTGRVESGRVETPLGTFDCSELQTGQAVTVLVRPDAIQPNGGKGGFAARVLDSRFMGRSMRLTLAVDGIENPMLGASFAGDHTKPGTVLRFSVDPSGVFVFTSAGPNPT